MSKAIIFIQIHGRHGVLEAEVGETATLGDLLDALAAAGVEVDAETLIYIDESEEHLQGDRVAPVHGLKHGTRVHVGRCRRINVTVQFLDKTAEHRFAPGARVRRVKAWAVDKFGLDPKDAAEHVLQICSTTDRPTSDSPLHSLTHGHECSICFDLVPEKRVEG